jgi:uncharacterized membrane protein YjfL (UPF0719 family)
VKTSPLTRRTGLTRSVILLGVILFTAGCGRPKDPLVRLRMGLADTPTYSIVLHDLKEEGDFFKQYFHQYLIVRPEQCTETDWLEVPQKLFRRYLPFLGMTVYAKQDGEEITKIGPPGYEYVGNERYGSWHTDSGGRSFWVFYGQYRLLSDLLGGVPVFLKQHRIYTSRSSPYFGPNREYGTEGSVTKTKRPDFYLRRMATAARQQSAFTKKVYNRIARTRTAYYRLSSGSGKRVMTLDTILTGSILIVGFFFVLVFGMLMHNVVHREHRLKFERAERDNPALALAMAGYFMGLVIAVGGALVGLSAGIVEDSLDLVIYGALSIVLLNVSWFICDGLILHKFRVSDELVQNQNLGTGAVSAGVSIASGFIIHGSIHDQGGSIWTVLAFWAIGQAVLVIAGRVCELITPYSTHKEIERDNVAAGISFAGALIGIGVIIGLASERDFISWGENLTAFLGYALMGLILLPIVRFSAVRLLLPTVRLSNGNAEQRKPNLGAACIEAFVYVAAAFIIHWCV